MVGVINPNATQTYELQLESAENATFQMTPGEAFPSETASSSGSSATSSSSSSSSGSGSSSSDHHHLSAGAIAGIAIGGAAVLVLAAAVVYLCGRRGGLDKAYHRQGHSNNRATYQEPMVEARYVGPKSPGQETFSTTAYTATPPNDPYQHVPGPQLQGLGMSHGVAPAPYSVSSGSPPPVSEYSQSLHNHPPRWGSPQISAMDGTGTMQTGYL